MFKDTRILKDGSSQLIAELLASGGEITAVSVATDGVETAIALTIKNSESKYSVVSI